MMQNTSSNQAEDSTYETGVRLAESGAHDRALALLTPLWLAGDEWGAFAAGNSLLELGRQAEAARAFEYAEAHGIPEATYNLGCALMESGLDDEAARVFERAIDRGYPQGWLGLARIYRRRGDWRRALESIRRCRVSSAGQLSQYAYTLDQVWSLIADPSPAWEGTAKFDADAADAVGAELSEVVKRFPNFATEMFQWLTRVHYFDAYLEWGSALCELPGRARAAERIYRKGAELGDSRCRTNLALLLIERGYKGEGYGILRRQAETGDEIAAAFLGQSDCS